jgi:itaconyl-CoA hydratase
MPDASRNAVWWTSRHGYFEDFPVGQRMRHSRGQTIGEVENQYLSKQVMNTAQAHWNEHAMKSSSTGNGRLVFGLITASAVIGLAGADTGEHVLAEMKLDKVRFVHPVHHGDTIYAYTEVLSASDSDREDAGIVCFAHWGLNQDREVVCELERTALMKRRSHWGDGAP